MLITNRQNGAGVFLNGQEGRQFQGGLGKAFQGGAGGIRARARSPPAVDSLAPWRH